MRHSKILIFDVTPLSKVCYSPNELGQLVNPYNLESPMKVFDGDQTLFIIILS